MARKKAEPIETLGNDTDKLTVQKSLPLFSLWRSDLTLAEFKILDVYLSRIDSRKPDKRTVIFSKGELEEILGVKRIKTEELDKRLKNLGTPIRIDDQTAKNKKFARISLFEKSMAEQDENGQWTVELTASQSAMKYFFNIESLGYLRYKLRSISSLQSRYSYVMFIYLEQNRFRKTWTVSVDELKNILRCENEETYKSYTNFNKLLLKRVKKELDEKTECRFTYKPVRTGRTVTAIEITLETLSDKVLTQEEDKNQITIDQYLEESTPKDLWEEAVEDFHFTDKELAELREALVCVPSSRMPETPANFDNEHLERYHYMKQKAAEIERRGNIKNKFAYLLKVVKKDAGID